MAFYGCNALTSITISAGVTSIGMVALGFTAITSVTLPSTVTTIGRNILIDYLAIIIIITITNE